MVSETLALEARPVATVFKLIIEDDEGKTTVYPLADGDISIGRREGNTIRLMERNVSRRHARLMRQNGTVFIEDLDSYNGIRINGERINGRYEVKEGDLVEIGDYHLALQRQEIEMEAEPQAKPEGWPAAGTVPDFRLPDEIVAQPEPIVSTRDTIVDQPAPPELPQAIAATLDAKSDGRALPPFKIPSSPTAARGSPAFEAPPVKVSDEEPTRALSVGPARVSAVARLVCVSTSYAGREFALTRPELIIGRVEDNDIVIEHRSVSRNHAKVLFDGRTHKIVDLQSANGILVNGEEYAMTDLRKNDLIELGHVRFRFVPPGEDFAPSDDEAREMREAGVEPPSPSKESTPARLDVPPEVSGFDPSTAATVTDTPLSALHMSEVLAPKVEVPRKEARKESHPSHPPKNGAPVKRATDDERPTEINQASKRVPPPAAPTAPMAVAAEPRIADEPTRREVVDEAPHRPGKPIGLIIAALAILGVLAASIVVLTMTGGPDGALDAKLKGLLDQDKFEEARQLCNQTSPNEFADPENMKILCKYAHNQASSLQPPPPEAPPVDDVEGSVVEPDDPDIPVVEPPRAKGRPPKRDKKNPAAAGAEAKAFATKGKKLLLEGKVSAAEEALVQCVQKDPDHADCHRLLGVLFAQKDETAKSIKHYKRYVDLKPDAPDAARVNRMIRDAEQQSP
jgi:pSer/pThr/pTyr-binding forkhead associated (FHA) protein